MIGPSAMGSLNGTPISIKSAPAFGSSNNILLEILKSGSPAVTKVIKAALLASFKSLQSLSWFNI